MSNERLRVLSYVCLHPGRTDYSIHHDVAGDARLMESTVKHLLRLRDAGLVRSEGSAALWHRRWYPVEPQEATT